MDDINGITIVFLLNGEKLTKKFRIPIVNMNSKKY